MYGIIISGGSGTRFWPKSRELQPKPLLKIFGPKTLIQGTVERLLPVIPVQNLYVITNELTAFETCSQLSGYGFEPNHLFAEPSGRNTAAAIGLAAHILRRRDPEEVMAVFPADHLMHDREQFLKTLREAEHVARQGYLVTLGVQPSRPETGYGYIKKGPPVDGVASAFKVERFVEKPSHAVAQQYMDDGGYFWNCGIFLGKASAFLAEFERHLPELHATLGKIAPLMAEVKGKYNYHIMGDHAQPVYESIPSVSIDYGIMEKSSNVAVVAARLNWSDVGAWTALEDILDKDAEGNIFGDNVVALDSAGCIVEGTDRLIAAVGIKNLIVVDTPDALLLCDKHRAQDVKKVVEQIREKHPAQANIHTTVQRPWGSYTVIERRDNYLVKRVDVYPGEKLSLQSHNHRSEHWTVASGTAKVQRDSEVFTLNHNESMFIPKGVKHRLTNATQEPLIIIEVQIGNPLDESDIVRYTDIYGRS